MKKITCFLSFICIVFMLKAQNRVLFVTDGAVGKDGQVLNIPDNPQNKKSVYFAIDSTTSVLPDTLLHSKKINLCVLEDVVIQFNGGKPINITMPSMDGTKSAWASYTTGSDRQKYGEWLYDRLDFIQNQLDAYSDKLLTNKLSNANASCAFWMMKVSVNILLAKTKLLETYY